MKGSMSIASFNAIDVETANADRSSICQIGIVHVRDGRIQDTWKALINPEDWFDWFNIEVHGIEQKDVEDAPTLPEVRDELRRRLRGSILVSHTSFDRVAFERAMDKYDLAHLDVTWLDSARVARRAWPEQFGSKHYGLSSVAGELGIEFQHHDALEDAQAAAQIVLRACEDTGLDVKAWMERVKEPISPGKQLTRSRREGAPEGHLYGEAIVFTGALSLSRRAASDRAVDVGCTVLPNVTKKTTMLVVGVQDRAKLSGYEKSRKHRKAEEYIGDGIGIQIMSEDDFLAMITYERPAP